LRRRGAKARRAPTTVKRSPSAAAAAAPPLREPAPEPAPAPEPEREPEPAAAAPVSDCDHYWEVAYDRGQLGEDGVWRFPHHCRNCGLQLVASDVSDATAQAAQKGSTPPAWAGDRHGSTPGA